jgi:tetratricopeptide (TPR) repeat protein
MPGPEARAIRHVISPPEQQPGTLSLSRALRAGVPLLLVALVWAVYWSVGSNGFVAYDDPGYIQENPVVKLGLTADGVRWAFTTWTIANWHPLTWLSHMLDVQLFGVEPAWHHRENVLWHCANTLLLLAFLGRTTGGWWRSALVAALFSVHPLRVESVAWISERKDVLSTFFFLLALLAYAAYARRQGALRYLAVALAFALGLLAKPMVVTLPALLLLLDVWPLRRLPAGRLSATALWPLLREKLPLFALSAVSSAVTFLAQARGGAVRSVVGLPFSARAANAVVSAASYLGKTLWPTDLAVLYPHPGYRPGGIPAWKVAFATALLLGITAIALREVRRRPYLLAGWGWYLVTVLPVIGLVQVGQQGMADRYTYLPLIGPVFAAVWAAAEGAEKLRMPRAALAVAGLVLVLGAAWIARVQVGYWRDTLTLFDHATRVTEDNRIAWKNVGSARFERGEPAEALAAFAEATRIDPEDPDLWFDQGMALSALGRYREATSRFEQAIRLEPSDGESWFNLGITWAKLRQPDRVAAVAQRLRPLDPVRADELERMARLLAGR